MESMEIKKVLVTGSEGYIGAILVPKLIKKGYKVTGLDTCLYGRFNTNSSSFKLIQKDIRDTSFSFAGIDCIIHLAALSNDPIGELAPNLTEQINYKATIKLAKKAKSAGVKRFIFSSSCSVYGLSKGDTRTEKSSVNPLTTYAMSKIESEKKLIKLADRNFCVSIMRNATVYGYSPSFRNDLVVNNFVTCALATGEIRVMSDGTPWRPLIDVRDLSDFFICFIKTPAQTINGKIFNVGFAENNVRVKDILDIIHKSLPQCKIVYTGEHGADTRSYKVSFSKLQKLFPKVQQLWSLEKSVADLTSQLHKRGFKRKDFEIGKYIRITRLRELLDKKKINDDLIPV